MKHYKSVNVPAKTERVLDITTCDFCHTAIKEEPYEVAEVTLKCRTGEVFPGAGWGKEESVDICPDCYRNQLLPWLASKGVSPSVEDWDY